MLEQAPRGEGLPRGLDTTELERPLGDRVLERDVSVTLAEQLDKVVPQCSLRIGATTFGLDGHVRLLA